MAMRRPKILLTGLLLFASLPALAERKPVAAQIQLPHNYYYREMYLPQLTSGPSALTFSPDGKELVYSMGGSLWRQTIGSDQARELVQQIDALGIDTDVPAGSAFTMVEKFREVTDRLFAWGIAAQTRNGQQLLPILSTTEMLSIDNEDGIA